MCLQPAALQLFITNVAQTEFLTKPQYFSRWDATKNSNVYSQVLDIFKSTFSSLYKIEGLFTNNPIKFNSSKVYNSEYFTVNRKSSLSKDTIYAPQYITFSSRNDGISD